jgi:arylsulfatase A-like enzyme
LHFNAPHWPWEGPGDEAESKRLEGTSLRDFDGGTQKTYQRMIGAMDEQIGRVLEALDANGLTENTIVIFTSDNGGERFADTWPFTGKKTDLLESGLRIPMVIAWPARITPGRTSDQVAISMDWLPTLLAAAGTAPDPGYSPDGMNLLPVLTGNAAAVDRKLFWRYKGKWQRAARIGDYKFLKILDNTFLFNVVEDLWRIEEDENLKKRFPPRPLEGMTPSAFWAPPEEYAELMASYRRAELRELRCAKGEVKLRLVVREVTCHC